MTSSEHDDSMGVVVEGNAPPPSPFKVFEETFPAIAFFVCFFVELMILRFSNVFNIR